MNYLSNAFFGSLNFNDPSSGLYTLWHLGHILKYIWSPFDSIYLMREFYPQLNTYLPLQSLFIRGQGLESF